MPFINLSVITVTWENLEELYLTLDSLKNSINKPSQVIVIDGGTVGINYIKIDSYKNEFSSFVFISEKDSGIYFAMNKGFEYVISDFILFLNSGDFVTNDCFPSEITYSGFLNYKTETFWGKKISNRISFFRYGMPVVHQAIIFPFTDLRYNTAYRVGADYDFYLFQRKKIAQKFYPTNGSIIYKRGGYSDINFLTATFERLKIIYYHFGILNLLFVFCLDIFKVLAKYLFVRICACKRLMFSKSNYFL